MKPMWKNKHVDTCEPYENDKLRNWPVWQGFIEGLTEKNSEAIKETYWQLAISTKMTNLGNDKWGIEQDSIKRLAKAKMKSQRGESWQMPNFGRNGA